MGTKLTIEFDYAMKEKDDETGCDTGFFELFRRGTDEEDIKIGTLQKDAFYQAMGYAGVKKP